MRKFFMMLMTVMFAFVLFACDQVELTLDAPGNVAITDGVVTWDAVEGAEEYLVFVGTQSFTVTTTSLDLTELGLTAGNYTVYVIAKAGEQVSLPSSNQAFNVEDITVDMDLLNQALFAMIDPTYEADLTEDDFEDAWEYRDYQRTTALVETFSQSAIDMGMNETTTLAIFTQVMAMMTTMGSGEIEDVSDMKAELDVFGTFGMEPADVSLLIYNMLLTAIDQIIMDETLGIEEDQNRLTEIEAMVNNFKTSTEGQALYLALKAYTPMAYYDDLDQFFALDFESWQYWELMNIIAYDIVPNVYYQWNDPYYLEWDNQFIPLFHEIFVAMKAAGQTAILEEFLYDSWPDMMSPFEGVVNYADELYWLNEDIFNAEAQIPLLQDFKQLLIDEEVMFKQAIEDFVTYVNNLYEAISPELLAALDTVSTGMFDLDEIFIIKDEVLDMLITTLPDAAAFGDMYEVLFTIAAAFGDTNATEMTVHAAYFGDIDHAVVELALLYIDSVTQTDVEAIMTITDGMVVEEEFYDEYWDYYYYETTTDPYKVIELALYVLNHIDTFVTTNQTKVDALNTLLDDAEMEQVFTKVLNNFAAIASEQMSEEEAAILTMVVDEVIASYDDLKVVVNLMKTIGVDVLTEFMDSEAELILDILSLQDFDEPTQAMIAVVEEIIDDILPYNTAFFGPMDLATIESVLRVVRIPLLVAATVEGDILEADFNTAFEAIVDDAAQLIFNVRTLEELAYAQLAAKDLQGIIFGNGLGQEFDINLMVAVVVTLDDTLTTQFENLLFDSIDIVFDDIIGDTNILDLTGMLSNDVDMMQQEVIDMISGKIADIHTARGYIVDGTLTPEDITFIQGIFNDMPEEPALN